MGDPPAPDPDPINHNAGLGDILFALQQIRETLSAMIGVMTQPPASGSPPASPPVLAIAPHRSRE